MDGGVSGPVLVTFIPGVIALPTGFVPPRGVRVGTYVYGSGSDQSPDPLPRLPFSFVPVRRILAKAVPHTDASVPFCFSGTFSLYRNGNSPTRVHL